ncbi:inositol monophosphatase family protein [Thermocatellispora tengchongensis]|uniref:inositol monophosphatase family protein n=1 Tax=Thermocatellispora tengchongensis TaxID=1073253 RepID=UPI003627F77D
MDLDHALRVAVEAAEAAGALLLDGVSGAGPRVRAKGGGGDVVTDLDMAAEKLILERLLTGFPGHRVIAEESGLAGAADGEWTWLVDPLDGTNNVAIGLPVYVVGLALCRDGAPVLGVVHEPVTGRTWSAVHGRGAVGPGGRRLSPPYRPTAHGPTVAWTQGHGVRRGDPVAGAVRNALGLRARRVLQLWAPAARLGDAGPRRHRRHRGLPRRAGGPARRAAAGAGGGHGGARVRRHPVRLRHHAARPGAHLRRLPSAAAGRAAGDRSRVSRA